MIASVLVANRGEIARRVFRTCRDLGIATVAVHSDADAAAPHVREADAAVRLPGDAPADTYLRGDLIVKAALATGADAVHPGYGFLSENADFARSVIAAGLTWIGPAPEAIEAMGSKTRAKRLMAEAGCPGAGGRAGRSARTGQGGCRMAAGAACASSGRPPPWSGRSPPPARRRCPPSATARSSWSRMSRTAGDIEVQVLADTHGTVWTLGERDCSVQRRHQKVIEETPAPGVTDELRRTLRTAAEAAARAIGYVGAGTVEFLVSPDGLPYFLEMNTRLQVEHPVTECVFGVDLVALQLEVAEGERLPAAPPLPSGHAVEARLYAEDPARDWQPQTGVLHRFRLPRAPGLRVDAGFGDGDRIGVHYDAMLAKVVAHAATRAQALRMLAGALERTRVHGLVTNRDLLVRVLRDADFAAGRLSTAFLDRLGPAPAEDEGAARLAALAAALADASGRHPLGGWRNVPSAPQSKTYRAEPGGAEYEVRYRLGRDGLTAEGHPDVRLLERAPERVVLEVAGVRRAFEIAVYADQVCVDGPLGSHRFTALPRFPDPVAQLAPGSLLAPMPGTVVRVSDVAVGDKVAAGQPLLWLEAMKMEHRVAAPADGVLTALHAEAGRQVDVGAVLAVVQEEDSP